MSEQKRYTVQELRGASDNILSVHRAAGIQFVGADNNLTKVVKSMLRQAADAEEENAQFKARLDSVVKECEKINEEKFRMNEVLAAKGILNRILRAARGESENENK